MDYDTYESNAVELAVDLANTGRDVPGWDETFLTAHEDWFTPGTSLHAEGRDVARLAALADLVRSLAAADDQASAMRGLNDLLGLARPRPYATDHDGELHLHYAREDAGLLEQVTTTVAMGLSQLVVQHGWQRLGICSAETCDDVYVDTSRNASRRYCSNTCASRSTVAAYRARRRT
ncbi:CGNR zinc finger domain-containing protein [Goekera deserti]|uniref:CGNR zinc finger domain-containing protein n=1 Tax=Goekera deserti TaxID=2497753 RepID=A0A7K3WF30_9ACTN|nr:CGNR zinc finger domain-containing protein [Goekera deserti]NDI48614.1 CGNR zinc finger domain-containing protein [Goekera deserti]NEL55007.1 CGNR zinc finger domain-containing protein [Goekera deserti]